MKSVYNPFTFIIQMLGNEGNLKTLSCENILGRELNDVEKKYAPQKLFVKGSIPLPIYKPRISVVGTRKPSEVGINITKNLVRLLVKNGIAIFSGLARGIDTVAHKTAIEENGDTIAVLGTPINRYYPPENKELQELMERRQLVISQFDMGHYTNKRDFLTRNRLMALLSDITIIMEAGEVSGSISQGWETLRLGRKLYICSPTFENESLEWPREMQKYGANELDIGNFELILEETSNYVKASMDDQ
jgi:DNA processing protein